MPKRTSSYDSWRLKKLADPQLATAYLNAAMNDSREMFLKALRNVTQAQQVAKIAQKAGIQRESLYRALSAEGNPTLDTLHSVLHALGLRMEIAVAGPAPSEKEPESPLRKRQPDSDKTSRRRSATKRTSRSAAN